MVSIVFSPSPSLGNAYAVLLLLDLIHGAILESPPEDIGLVAGVGDNLGFGQGGPEVLEVLELDEVPDTSQRRLNDD